MLSNCGVGEDSWESFGLQVNPKGNQSWIFIRRIDAEADTPILWPPDAKSWLIGKDPHVGKDWRQEEKGTAEDEMVGWHHQLDEHEFEQALGTGDGEGSLACCCPRAHRESDIIEQLNWTELNWTGKIIALTRQTLVSKMMSLLFNMLSRFVIAVLPGSKDLLITWLQSPSAVILECRKIKPVTVSIFPHIFAMQWWDWMHDLNFLNVDSRLW